MTTAAKDANKDIKDDEKVARAGIPKDWVAPNMQISTDVKFCDMKVDYKEYAMMITEYIYVQMVKSEIVYLKDGA
jgi:hypothetical protein